MPTSDPAHEFGARLRRLIDAQLRALVAAVAEATRNSILEDLFAQLDDGGVTARRGSTRRTPSQAARSARARLGAADRDYGCIAPACRNPSKGPRFHYLCEKHMKTPKSVYREWRRRRTEERATAGRAKGRARA